MPSVLLLGDSIRLGYQESVQRLLAPNADVIFPEENGRDCTFTLWQANQIFKRQQDQFDVIHWNNGYWDMNVEAPMTEALHPVNEYAYYLKRMVKFFREHTRYLIFANSLPVEREGAGLDNSGTGAEIHYQNEWVKMYNQVADEVMQTELVTVNDLYSVCAKQPGYYKCADHLHLNDEGNNVVANEIANLISAALQPH